MFLAALYAYLRSEDLADPWNASDWGTAAWGEDRDWAFGQAWEWNSITANAREWDYSAQFSAEMMITWAYMESTTAEGFWEALAAQFSIGPSDDSGLLPRPTGWDKLGKTYAQAANTSYTISEARDLGKLSTMAKAAIEKTGVELTDKGASGWETARPWVIGAGALVGVVALARTLK